jgi:CHAT domain-containing protein/tetratricopeptide (TPR) repeat protein
MSENGPRRRQIVSEFETELRRHADAGNARAAYELGKLLDARGEVGSAVEWWQKAAAGGYAAAATNIGVRLARADRLDEAQEWFARGAEGGDAQGAYNLGLLAYRRERPDEAERWWRKAAGLGDAQSASNVGELLSQRGELEEAETWWRRGAEAGDFSGASQLGHHLYDTGRLDEAEVWLRRLAQAGDARAAERLDALLAERPSTGPERAAGGGSGGNGYGSADDGLLFRAITRRAAGDGHFARGLVPKALEAYDESLAALAKLAELGEAHPKVLTLHATTELQAGHVHHAVGEREQAEACFRRAAAVAERFDAKGALLATILNDLGVVRFESGDYAGAIELYERALAIDEAIDPTSAETGRDLNNLGNAHQDAGDPAGALPILEQARDIDRARDPGSPELALSLRNVASCHTRLDDDAGAAAQLEEALAIYDAAGETSEDTAEVLTALGQALIGLSRQPEAQPLLERARDFYVATAPGSDVLAETLNSLGRAYLMQGATAAAFDAHRRALEIHRANGSDPRLVVRDLINIGGVYEEQGDAASALGYYEQARAAAAPDDPGLLYALTNIGQMRMTALDVDGALEVWQSALDLARERGERLQEATLLKGMGEAVMMRAEFERARGLYEQALPIVEELAPGSVQLSTLYGSLSTSLWVAGDEKRSLEYAEKAVAIIRATLPRSRGAALILDQLGLSLLSAGRNDDGIAALEEAVEITEALRARAGTSAGQEGIFSLHQSPYEKLVIALAADRDLDSAFHYVERSRARTLVELLAERRVQIEPESDEQRALVEEERALQERLAVLYNAGAHDGDEARETRARLDEFRQQLRRTFAAYAQIEHPEPAGLADVRARLDPRTLLLELEVTQGATLVWTIRGGTTPFGLRQARLGAHGVETLVDRIVGPYRRAGGGRGAAKLMPPPRLSETLARAAADRAAARAELATLLLDEIPPQVWRKVERVVVVPDGPLHYVPFDLLPLPHEPDVLLGDRYPVAYAPSATALLTLLDEPAHARDSERVFVGFGDPAYGSGPAGDALAAAGLARLGGSRREVERIAASVGRGARTYVDADATEARVKMGAVGYRYVHFATHGLLDDRDPLYSGLALAPPAPGEDGVDDFLQVYELFNLRLAADLVVCSACQTGLGPVRAGEGIVGMTRALFFAGARCVVVSLWPVPDAPTALLMEALYERLGAGDAPAAALQEARRAVRADADPFAWGGFVPIGLALDRI